jgi:hypothetical protein
MYYHARMLSGSNWSLAVADNTGGIQYGGKTATLQGEQTNLFRLYVWVMTMLMGLLLAMIGFLYTQPGVPNYRNYVAHGDIPSILLAITLGYGVAILWYRIGRYSQMRKDVWNIKGDRVYGVETKGPESEKELFEDHRVQNVNPGTEKQVKALAIGLNVDPKTKKIIPFDHSWLAENSGKFDKATGTDLILEKSTHTGAIHHAAQAKIFGSQTSSKVAANLGMSPENFRSRTVNGVSYIMSHENTKWIDRKFPAAELLQTSYKPYWLYGKNGEAKVEAPDSLESQTYPVFHADLDCISTAHMLPVTSRVLGLFEGLILWMSVSDAFVFLFVPALLAFYMYFFTNDLSGIQFWFMSTPLPYIFSRVSYKGQNKGGFIEYWSLNTLIASTIVILNRKFLPEGSWYIAETAVWNNTNPESNEMDEGMYYVGDFSLNHSTTYFAASGVSFSIGTIAFILSTIVYCSNWICKRSKKVEDSENLKNIQRTLPVES